MLGTGLRVQFRKLERAGEPIDQSLHSHDWGVGVALAAFATREDNRQIARTDRDVNRVGCGFVWHCCHQTRFY